MKFKKKINKFAFARISTREDSFTLVSQKFTLYQVALSVWPTKKTKGETPPPPTRKPLHLF